MSNIFGKNGSGLLPVTKEVTAALLKGYNVNTVEEFTEKLGTTFDASTPDLYPHTTNGLETDALTAALFNNIATIIGEFYDTGSISEKIKEYDDKLTTVIDGNILLSLMARVFGVGIYNNGTNGDLYDISYDSNTLSFLAMPVDMILDVEGSAFYKSVPGYRVAIEYKNYTFANSTTIFRYGIVMNPKISSSFSKIINTEAYEYILNKSITHIDDVETGATLFLMLADGLSDDLQYQKFITNKAILDIHDVYVETDDYNVINSFYYKRCFEPIQTTSFHLNTVMNALKGNSVRFYFPKNKLVEELDIENNITVYNDGNGMTSTLEVNKILDMKCDNNATLANRDAYIYFVDADASLKGVDFDPSEYYLFAYSFRSGKFEINTLRNRFISKNGTQSYELARNTKLSMWFVNLPSAIDYEVNGMLIFDNSQEFSFKLNNKVKNNTWVYPLKGGHLFNDPFYRTILTKYYDQTPDTDPNYVEVYKTDSAAIMGSILRDRSIASEKIRHGAVRTNNIATDSVIDKHLNSESMSKYSLTNFKQDYPAENLAYKTNEIFSTFRGTNLDKFNIGKFCDLQIIQLGNSVYNENFSYTNSGKSSLVFNNYEHKAGILQNKLSLVSGYNGTAGQQTTLEAFRLVATNNIESKVLTITNRPGNSTDSIATNEHKYHANFFITAQNDTIHVGIDGRVGQESKSCYFTPEKLGGTGGNDIADLYPILNSKEVEAGFFYSIKDDKAYKTTSKHDKFRVGIATKDYSVFAGDPKKDHIAVALKGFVTVKYHGKLSAGDVVTNSNKHAGYVHKRLLFGDKIGRVMKIIDDNTCTIFIL